MKSYAITWQNHLFQIPTSHTFSRTVPGALVVLLMVLETVTGENEASFSPVLQDLN